MVFNSHEKDKWSNVSIKEDLPVTTAADDYDDNNNNEYQSYYNTDNSFHTIWHYKVTSSDVRLVIAEKFHRATIKVVSDKK